MGHGQWGVGLKAVDAQPEKGLPRRLWGTTYVYAKDAGSWDLNIPVYDFLGYQALPDVLTDRGIAWWQQHAGGHWAIAALQSSGGRSFAWGVRMSKRVGWIKGVFPGAQTLTDRLTVTESTPFVSRNFDEDIEIPTVYFTVPAGQANA